MIVRLRWLAVIPAAIGGWLVAFVLGLLLVGVLDGLCPPELVVSGMCTAPWYDAWFKALVLASVSLAAILVVMLASVVAPARRRIVARVAFGAGAAYAIYGAVVTRSYWELAVALASGALAVWAVGRFLR